MASVYATAIQEVAAGGSSAIQVEYAKYKHGEKKGLDSQNFSNNRSLSLQVVEEDVDHIGVLGEEEETRVRIFCFFNFLFILFAACSQV